MREQFAEMVEPHQNVLYAGALRLTSNKADAEDLLQETFMRAFAAYRKNPDIEKPRAWLFKIMTNAYINRYHKERRRPRRQPYEEDLSHRIDDVYARPVPDPQDQFFAQFLDDEIKNALNWLPEHFRRAVILCDISGLSYEEIAKVLECPLGTVRSRISRGREMLFHKLYDYARDKGLLPREETAARA